MDIIGAMNKEREYLSFRVKGEEPFHLVDAVKEYGFDSLKNYFEAKKDYEFSKLKFEVVETTPDKAIKDVLDTIAKQKNSILFAVTDKTLVWNGDNGQYDAEYCNECGIPIYPLYTGGGTIVSTAGDLNIGICFPADLTVDENYILNKFAQTFRKYTDKSVKVSGNDILIDNIKVLGSSIYKENGMFMFITPVSLSNKTDLICKICLKHSTKQPGNIDFMNAETLKNEVMSWSKNTFI